jgi:predicted AlkP superfamily phosphohydrolase/phosphomutase
VAIIGLDGADWSLLQPLFDQGLMPTLKSFVDASASATLQSVLPTNSMSAWTSMMTGVNPGKHGVFDFVRPSGTPFRTLVTNSARIRYPTLGETLTNAGMSSCFIDMPPFYPPFEIDGVMLGGMGALGLDRLSYPAEAATIVRDGAGGYADDMPWLQYGGRDEEFEAGLHALTDNRVRVAEAMLSARAFDLFCLVIVTPDRAQHALWKDITEDGPRRAMAERVFRSLDGAVARLLERIDIRETDVLIVSDHGFRGVNKVVGVNEVLARSGLTRPEHIASRDRFAMGFLQRAPLPAALRLNAIQRLIRSAIGKPRSLGSGSKTYSDTAESVSVNLAGRESTGLVPPEQYDEVVTAAIAALMEFQDPTTGVHPIRRASRRGDHLHGDLAPEAPDILLEFADGYAYSGLPGREVRTWPPLQGVHRREGIIACAGPQFRAGARIDDAMSILDVAPTVLALLGLAARDDADGAVADALLSRATTERRALRRTPAGSRGEARQYSDEDEEQIKERLRGLGYIE